LLYGSSIELYVDEAQAREDWGAWCEGLSALRHVLPAAEWSAWAGDEPIRFDADRQAYDPASVPAWRLEEDASPPAEAPPGAAAPPRELRTASRRHAAPPGLYRLFGQDIFSREEEAYEIADFTTLEKACAERDRRRRSSGAAADLADHYFVVDDRGWLRG
jgi:hypothetical protein